MQINLETTDKYSIQAYTNSQIKINEIVYQNSLIVSKQGIVTDWLISHINQLNDNYLEALLSSQPEVIIIGHQNQGSFPPMSTIESLSRMRIGLECMSIGAACRTYNVLLGEHRNVILGIII